MRKLHALLVVLVIASATIGFIPSHAATGEDPVLVATDQTNDGAVTGDDSTSILGWDIIAAYVHQPDFSKPEIEFIWQLTALPPVVPPEVSRYLWTFGVNGKNYQVLAKTTDAASATAIDNPPTVAVEQATTVGAFRVRGNCETIQVYFCHQLKWVTGVFDSEHAQVRVTVPLNDPAFPDIKPGAVIDPDITGNFQISTGGQAVASNSAITDLAAQGCSYTIPTGDAAPGVGDCIV